MTHASSWHGISAYSRDGMQACVFTWLFNVLLEKLSKYIIIHTNGAVGATRGVYNKHLDLVSLLAWFHCCCMEPENLALICSCIMPFANPHLYHGGVWVWLWAINLCFDALVWWLLSRCRLVNCCLMLQDCFAPFQGHLLASVFVLFFRQRWNWGDRHTSICACSCALHLCFSCFLPSIAISSMTLLFFDGMLHNLFQRHHFQPPAVLLRYYLLMASALSYIWLFFFFNFYCFSLLTSIRTSCYFLCRQNWNKI